MKPRPKKTKPIKEKYVKIKEGQTARPSAYQENL